MIRILSCFFVCFSLIILAGCATQSTYAPVENIANEPLPKNGLYRVQAGDTLYSVAWRYGLDYRYLAKINNLSSSAQIDKGQKLFLTKAHINYISQVKIQKESKSRSFSQSITSKQNPTLQYVQPQLRVESQIKVIPQKSLNEPHIYTQPLVTSKPHVRPKKSSHAVVNREPTGKVTAWYWPAQGRIINYFSKLENGINITGKLGAPIYATAAGKVVYSGSGLRRYGKLIIIKHNNDYLSAYAHNNVVFVQAGDWVKARQKIAEMGSTGTVQTLLHFEIRRDGKPINPLQVLPRKR